MRWIFAAGLAFCAALTVSAQEGGAEPLDEALLLLGSDRWTEILSSRSRRAYISTKPCDRSAYRFDFLQRDMRMSQAMTRLADLPKTEQTELVRRALEYHLAVYSANLPEFLEFWADRLPHVIEKGKRSNTLFRMQTVFPGNDDGRDLLQWSRDAIHRLIVVAAAFELTDLTDEMDAIIRSALDTRELLLAQTDSEQTSNYAWSSLYNSTLYDPTFLAIGLSLSHWAARNPENLRSPSHGHFIIYVGRWPPTWPGNRSMWRHHVAADGTVTNMQNTPGDEPVIGSFLFAECLSEDQFATLLAACGFEAAAAQ